MKNPQENCPIFIGIGAAKSGTTWLAEVLGSHPQIFIPPEKELSFFSDDEKYAKGIHWYLNFFKNAKPKQVIGEFSVWYLPTGKKSAPRIFEFNKNMKLILIVRDPVERAISHYQWFKQLNRPVGSFSEALQSEKAITLNSLYYKGFLPFLEFFPKNQYLIIRYDDIQKNPLSIQQTVYQFLGVEPSYVSRLTNKTIGKTISPKSRQLENIRMALHQFFKKNHLAFLIRFSKKTGLSTLYRRLNDEASQQAPIGKKEKEMAYRYFENDLKSFAKLTDLDISMWIKKYENLLN